MNNRWNPDILDNVLVDDPFAFDEDKPQLRNGRRHGKWMSLCATFIALILLIFIFTFLVVTSHLVDMITK